MLTIELRRIDQKTYIVVKVEMKILGQNLGVGGWLGKLHPVNKIKPIIKTQSGASSTVFQRGRVLWVFQMVART